MLDSNPIEFKLSKNKLIGMVTAIASIAVSIGTIFQSFPEKLVASFPGSQYVMIGIACLGVVFVGVVGVVIFNKLRDFFMVAPNGKCACVFKWHKKRLPKLVTFFTFCGN